MAIKNNYKKKIIVKATGRHFYKQEEFCEIVCVYITSFVKKYFQLLQLTKIQLFMKLRLSISHSQCSSKVMMSRISPISYTETYLSMIHSFNLSLNLPRAIFAIGLTVKIVQHSYSLHSG